MEKLDNLAKADKRVLRDIRDCLNGLRQAVRGRAGTVEDGIATLREIRSGRYEDLNQIQHEAMILRAARFLEATHGKNIKWGWNPRQTGPVDEPDLRGIRNGDIILSAEITTSENPVGVIDGKMRVTLAKLARMHGQQYYFVGSNAMQKRALTKVQKLGFDIKVVKI